MDDGDYAVDLEELEGVIADLEKCERALESLTNDVEHHMKTLQSTWEGLSPARLRGRAARRPA